MTEYFDDFGPGSEDLDDSNPTQDPEALMSLAYLALEDGDLTSYGRLSYEARYAGFENKDLEQIAEWMDLFKRLHPGLIAPTDPIKLFRAIEAKGGFADQKPEDPNNEV